ncbi:MAG: VanZ family protein [Pirellulales bacterium]
MPWRFINYLRHPRIWQVILAGYWAALFVATHLPRVTLSLPGENTDKLIHFAAFAILAVFAALAWQLSAGRLTARHLCWIWVLIAIYGALDEWTQSAVGRNASASDWAADAGGAAIGLMLFRWLQRSRALRGRG